MQIKKMPEAERPQEKMLYGGPGCLSNSELLALIIRTGTGDKSAVRLADEVISYTNENTGGLGAAEVRELTEIGGIGEAKACSIVAAMELSKRMISDHQGAVKVRIRDSRQVADILTEEMMYEKRELFMTLNLNSRLQVESKSIISIGSLDSAPVHPREVFGPASPGHRCNQKTDQSIRDTRDKAARPRNSRQRLFYQHEIRRILRRLTEKHGQKSYDSGFYRFAWNGGASYFGRGRAFLQRPYGSIHGAGNERDR